MRVAMIGAGMISAYHLRAWSKLGSARVVAVVDPDERRAALRAREFGIPSRYASLEALLEREQVDALDIASPRETHEPILRLAVERGLAALCQKPFVPTFDDAEALVSQLPADARIMVNQNFRFRPYYQWIEAWIREGRLGAISGCTINTRSSGLLRDANGHYPYIERQPFVRGERRLMIEEVLIHRIDIARWLCGPLAVIAAHTHRGCPELVGESEASLLLVVRASGAPVVVDGNFASHGYPELSHDRVEIAGEHARVLLERDVLRLFGPQPEEHVFVHAEAYQQSFDATIAHFVACLEGSEPFLSPPEDNLETLRLVEDAYRSAAGRDASSSPA